MENIQVIIVNDCFFKDKIYGLNTCEWLKNKFECECDLNSAEEIKTVSLNKEYTLVLFSSYPLTRKQDVESIADITINKQLSYCQFNGGYLIKTSLINEKVNNLTSNIYNFEYNLQITDNVSLNKVKKQIKEGIINKHIENGVQFVNSDNVIIDATVQIAGGVVIGNGCELYGTTNIDQYGQILSNSVLNNVKVNKNVQITSSFLEDCEIKSGANIGPFARIRIGTEVGENCKIGNFVELKQAKIEKNTKISHLSYVGDAEIGENCNIGCSVVFCNYDGKLKHKTIVGNNCFIGSNVNLVAPLQIKDNCFIACGSTVDKNIGENKFAIERSKLVIKDNKFKK